MRFVRQPCRNGFERSARRHPDDGESGNGKGHSAFGVDWVDVETDALNYLKSFDITYANGPDIGTRIGPRYRITGVPETFIVDREGNIQFFKVSPVKQEELAAVFERLLKQ